MVGVPSMCATAGALTLAFSIATDGLYAAPVDWTANAADPDGVFTNPVHWSVPMESLGVDDLVSMFADTQRQWTGLVHQHSRRQRKLQTTLCT